MGIVILLKFGDAQEWPVAERFLAWLTPALRYGLLGGPKTSNAQFPLVGVSRHEGGLTMLKIGPLAYCRWKDQSGEE
jgi:hypothetical protein